MSTTDRMSRCLSRWDGTRDGTQDVLHQSQSQSQSQSPFLSLTALWVSESPPCVTTDRARDEAKRMDDTTNTPELTAARVLLHADEGTNR